MQCPKCEEQLEKIYKEHSPLVELVPSNEKATLYVCTSRDCKNAGVVLAIPLEAKPE